MTLARCLLLAIAAVLLATLPLMLDAYALRVATGMLMWAGLACAWNIVGGYAGYISFGHSAFFGIGAYATAMLMQQGIGWPFFTTLPVAILAAAGVAAAIGAPTMRLRGSYFAIATWAFAEMLLELVNVLGCYRWARWVVGAAVSQRVLLLLPDAGLALAAYLLGLGADGALALRVFGCARCATRGGSGGTGHSHHGGEGAGVFTLGGHYRAVWRHLHLLGYLHRSEIGNGSRDHRPDGGHGTTRWPRHGLGPGARGRPCCG
ncbi:MAG: branched-chain amino acid ABC transporter permease [Arhodomonas sp.]|nr:branched-chain amino acid ABC transporter permease [Arhodomonas sp.]